MAMSITEAYEKYKHLDKILSDPDLAGFNGQMAHDLWQAVKQAVQPDIAADCEHDWMFWSEFSTVLGHKEWRCRKCPAKEFRSG